MVHTRRRPLLVTFRASRAINQTEAGALVGITQSQWSLLENGRAFASPRVANRIAKLTGVTLESLLNLGDNDSVADAVG